MQPPHFRSLQSRWGLSQGVIGCAALPPFPGDSLLSTFWLHSTGKISKIKKTQLLRAGQPLPSALQTGWHLESPLTWGRANIRVPLNAKTFPIMSILPQQERGLKSPYEQIWEQDLLCWPQLTLILRGPNLQQQSPKACLQTSFCTLAYHTSCSFLPTQIPAETKWHLMHVKNICVFFSTISPWPKGALNVARVSFSWSTWHLLYNLLSTT